MVGHKYTIDLLSADEEILQQTLSTSWVGSISGEVLDLLREQALKSDLQEFIVRISREDGAQVAWKWARRDLSPGCLIRPTLDYIRKRI